MPVDFRLLILWLLILTLAGCAAAPGSGGPASSGERVYQRGEAAYYAASFDGRRTASGERFDSRALTAAHRTLPLGTRVQVTNLDNDRRVTVRINDRGPYTRGRIIDLSRAAAERLGMVADGVAPVELRIRSR
ncbi:septal ring lytic transglycosylase RlpA family protein [Salinisphaera sp. T31B1]|uniref:septal ring lytic transglycosylase RlpA family protein n=1 Tax=Salinisphaera sp. T31B1 TaxID=727963 RepID=UPI00334138AF